MKLQTVTTLRKVKNCAPKGLQGRALALCVLGVQIVLVAATDDDLMRMADRLVGNAVVIDREKIQDAVLSSSRGVVADA